MYIILVFGLRKVIFREDSELVELKVSLFIELLNDVVFDDEIMNVDDVWLSKFLLEFFEE